jgi:hypothetical protein
VLCLFSTHIHRMPDTVVSVVHSSPRGPFASPLPPNARIDQYESGGVAGRSGLSNTPSSRHVIMIRVLFDSLTRSPGAMGPADMAAAAAWTNGYGSLQLAKRQLPAMHDPEPCWLGEKHAQAAWREFVCLFVCSG